jgi:hypothetical protein
MGVAVGSVVDGEGVLAELADGPDGPLPDGTAEGLGADVAQPASNATVVSATTAQRPCIGSTKGVNAYCRCVPS